MKLDGRSWIPTFSSPFPFKVSFQTAARLNFGWVEMEDRAGRTTNTHLISSMVSKCQSFHCSKTYSIHSFAQLSWHGTGENNFWMVDLGFLFSHRVFSFTAFFSKTCKTELWMVRSWIPSFLLPISFQMFFAKTCKNELQMDRCGGRGAHHKHTQIPSILSFFYFSWF